MTPRLYPTNHTINLTSRIACDPTGKFGMCFHSVKLSPQVFAAHLLLLLLPDLLPGGVPHPHGGEETGETVHRGAAGDTTVLQSATA